MTTTTKTTQPPTVTFQPSSDPRAGAGRLCTRDGSISLGTVYPTDHAAVADYQFPGSFVVWCSTERWHATTADTIDALVNAVAAIASGDSALEMTALAGDEDSLLDHRGVPMLDAPRAR